MSTRDRAVVGRSARASLVSHRGLISRSSAAMLLVQTSNPAGCVRRTCTKSGIRVPVRTAVLVRPIVLYRVRSIWLGDIMREITPLPRSTCLETSIAVGPIRRHASAGAARHDDDARGDDEAVRGAFSNPDQSSYGISTAPHHQRAQTTSRRRVKATVYSRGRVSQSVSFTHIHA